MASTNPDGDSSSMFMQKYDKTNKSPTRSEPSSRRNSTVKTIPAEIITVKDFFDFMKTAYQVYEHLEGEDEEGTRINWEELTKLTVINHVIEQQERDLLYQTAFVNPKAIISKSDTAIEWKNSETERIEKRFSCSEIESCRYSLRQKIALLRCSLMTTTPSNLFFKAKIRGRRRSLPQEARVEMLGVWTEANLNCKLNDVINEGILDSILPYLVGYKKPSKTTSLYVPIIKKTQSNTSTNEVKKPASFGGFVNERESRDRLGRRKSSIIAIQERSNLKMEGDVEIHVCDEVKGLKKDFICPQKLLISKMGYFADVTAGQRLEDMDISVHCDIQIFDWLMRWVKRDTILVADWPLLDPANVVPILVSASFLQMEPLLHDCLIYCHAHMNEIVKTSTNLACLSDTLLTRLAAMYTNIELEAIRDRKDKILSRLFCKMILSLAEPVPETLRGHYATLATLFKCNRCNKLLGRHIAENVPCQPTSMRIDRRGNVLSTHAKDPTWNLNDYVTWLYGELRSWRRVYWRLWADCHFLKCQLCETFFPAYQMEWCSHHEQGAHMFAIDGRPPLPVGRYPCCGERAYRFEILTRNTGCQFRSHMPEEVVASDAAVLEVCTQFRDIIAMRPPHLVYPERLTRLVARGENHGRLQGKEVFWWEGLQLVPVRQCLGLLGKLYTNNTKFNPTARPGSPTGAATRASNQSLAAVATTSSSPAPPATETRRDRDLTVLRAVVKSGPALPAEELITKLKKGSSVNVGEMDYGAESGSSSESSEQSDESEASEEETPPRRHAPRTVVRRAPTPTNKRARVVGRQWVSSLSARSNQDGQRRFEERAVRQMKAALMRRAMPATTQKTRVTPGGVYAKLEAEWRERHGQKQRAAISARPLRAPIKYKT